MSHRALKTLGVYYGSHKPGERERWQQDNFVLMFKLNERCEIQLHWERLKSATT